MTTPNLGLTYMQFSQIMSNVTVNEAYLQFDSSIDLHIIDAVTTTPPSLPWNGDLYKVGTTGAGAWANLGGTFQFFYNGWLQIIPWAGFKFYDPNQSTKVFVYTVGWVSEASPGTIKSWTTS